ncbi:MAG: molybdenum cofactor biosynthesis protein MoaE [Phycisphaerales bacterium]|nr:molybdenum cofactor biosynthesis protein MoaE [Phycisphaerales bacterium]
MPAAIETAMRSGPVQPAGFTPPPPGGAEVVFVGRTRSELHPTHGSLQHLKYQAHTDMAAAMLQGLAEEAASRWNLSAVRVQHAEGVVGVGQASVCIEVVSDHRSEGFEACRWLIDTLKAQVPIWKQEVWADGTTWVDGHPVTEQA